MSKENKKGTNRREFLRDAAITSAVGMGLLGFGVENAFAQEAKAEASTGQEWWVRIRQEKDDTFDVVEFRDAGGKIIEARELSELINELYKQKETITSMKSVEIHMMQIKKRTNPAQNKWCIINRHQYAC